MAVDYRAEIDNFFDDNGAHLSMIAEFGYQQKGRGSIMIQMRARSPAIYKTAPVETEVMGYFDYQTLKEMRLDQPFYDLLDSYDPKSQGVISFVAGMEDAGFFSFQLSSFEDRGMAGF